MATSESIGEYLWPLLKGGGYISTSMCRLVYPLATVGGTLTHVT